MIYRYCRLSRIGRSDDVASGNSSFASSFALIEVKSNFCTFPVLLFNNHSTCWTCYRQIHNSTLLKIIYKMFLKILHCKPVSTAFALGAFKSTDEQYFPLCLYGELNPTLLAWPESSMDIRRHLFEMKEPLFRIVCWHPSEKLYPDQRPR